ncbi:MAG TPA: alanine--tRNA ligase [Chloroflexota bacterium]|nr:alanine--tRNA ligase [Chloroflexota bacterium]
MTSNQIRASFLQFFQEKNHLVLPSSSLVPQGNPSLLLTNAGMIQMMPYFLGEAVPPAPRLASAQKCFRTVDIDRVGDERHLTFFEMLGNFSVGDYFQEGAIAFAWEYLTRRVGLEPDRLYPSIYPTDEAAFRAWQTIAGVPPERIVRLEDNWWKVGPTGPNGPDSEIYYDRGEAYGCGQATCAPGCECARFLEIWNLVFMQYYTDQTGASTPLPRKNIDTGLGLERLTLLLQGKRTVYETDLFLPIVERAASIAGVTYGVDERTDYSLRVIADHSRAVTFLIADGVLPSNEGRGYILRRVLRRAIRHGRLLGIQQPFLIETVQVVIDLMAGAYGELGQRQEFILKVVEMEETRFSQTLTAGLSVLDQMIAGARESGQQQLSGQEVFRLYDTFGFPMELTVELAEEAGLTVDLDAFEQAMQQQRAKARAASKFGAGPRQSAEAYAQLPLDVTFLGYERLDATSQIVGMIVAGQLVGKMELGDEGEIVLRESPFYAESGGQVGDTGKIANERGVAEVLDTQRPVPHLIVQRVRIVEGALLSGDIVEASVEAERRADIARNHSATHLLHKALRETLGTHVQQAGSLVAPDRLRFDFTHFRPVSPDELAAIERRVNQEIQCNLPKETTITTYQEALAAGAMALFGEKYGERVRMVCLGDYSCELCGGTHVERSGDIGFFLIVAEESVGAGVRRIDAVVGQSADRVVRERLSTLDRLAKRLGGEPEQRVQALLEELQEERRHVAQLQRQLAAGQVEGLLRQAVKVDGVKVITATVQAPNQEALREMGDILRERAGRGVVVLGSVFNGKPGLVAMVTPGVAVNASELVRKVAGAIGGSGGGRPDVAQAGGRFPDKLNEALDQVVPLVRTLLAH